MEVFKSRSGKFPAFTFLSKRNLKTVTNILFSKAKIHTIISWMITNKIKYRETIGKRGSKHTLKAMLWREDNVQDKI